MNEIVKEAAQLPDRQTVLSVKHWDDQLFSFRVSRPASFRFRSGEFVMIGLMGDPHPKTGRQVVLMMTGLNFTVSKYRTARCIKTSENPTR